MMNDEYIYMQELLNDGQSVYLYYNDISKCMSYEDNQKDDSFAVDGSNDCYQRHGTVCRFRV